MVRVEQSVNVMRRGRCSQPCFYLPNTDKCFAAELFDEDAVTFLCLFITSESLLVRIREEKVRFFV